MGKKSQTAVGEPANVPSIDAGSQYRVELRRPIIVGRLKIMPGGRTILAGDRLESLLGGPEAEAIAGFEVFTPPAA